MQYRRLSYAIRFTFLYELWLPTPRWKIGKHGSEVKSSRAKAIKVWTFFKKTYVFEKSGFHHMFLWVKLNIDFVF